MRTYLRVAVVLSLASIVPLGACGRSEPATPTTPSRATATEPAASVSNAPPQERAVLAAMEEYKQAVLDSDVDALARIWADGYTFINPQGVLVTRAERLANFASGNTNVGVIDDEREITVRVSGDAAMVQNLSTLRGTFSGQPTATDLRGTFVWARQKGRWQLLTNQLTPVVP
ncbi:MAG TPA: nuclear transport factor 2 family protein [Gemmatimonadaceae bacterium]|jgi:ketosteroid isomerase-like protein